MWRSPRKLESVALWLDDNKITGTIPTEIGLLTELASISLTNATLRGPIPTELGKLSGLRRLWLYSNKLTGSIPAELNHLSGLEVLQVHNNSLNGAMPQGICSIIDKSPYEFKSLTSDCVTKVTCDSSCCTECY
jgi:Leucine-rich repeat (LRR) protein